MKARHDFLGKQHLGITRIATVFAFALEFGNRRISLETQQVVPIPHERIGNAHHLAEHLIGTFRDADVVVLGLTHLIDAIKAHQQGHREDALRFLAILALQFAAHKQIEALVGTAEFQIGMKSDRVVALHQGVDQFVHGNR